MHQSMLGVRPRAEAVEAARHALAHIDFCLLQQLEKSHVMEVKRLLHCWQEVGSNLCKPKSFFPASPQPDLGSSEKKMHFLAFA